MSGAGPQAPDVFLLQGSRGALYAAYFPPAPGVTSRGDVLYCPPFAEVMASALMPSSNNFRNILIKERHRNILYFWLIL